jgi:Fur family transcriptional regulator, ferric uptake regulator
MSNEWDDVLRDQGYRITPQRQLVLEAVNTLGHATPEELLRKFKRLQRQ